MSRNLVGFISTVKCEKCKYDGNAYIRVNGLNNEVQCPECGEFIAQVGFPEKRMSALSSKSSKARPFKFDPHEPNADKSIWKSVIVDAQKGVLQKGELEYWKKEIGRTSPNIIL